MEDISKLIQGLSTPTLHEGLEFIRILDRVAINGVILAPPVASLAFVLLWLSLFLKKSQGGDTMMDVQVVVTTAFTIAAYLVTAGTAPNTSASLVMLTHCILGSLIIALVAYLDISPKEDDASARVK